MNDRIGTDFRVSLAFRPCASASGDDLGTSPPHQRTPSPAQCGGLGHPAVFRPIIGLFIVCFITYAAMGSYDYKTHVVKDIHIVILANGKNSRG